MEDLFIFSSVSSTVAASIKAETKRKNLGGLTLHQQVEQKGRTAPEERMMTAHVRAVSRPEPPPLSTKGGDMTAE